LRQLRFYPRDLFLQRADVKMFGHVPLVATNIIVAICAHLELDSTPKIAKQNLNSRGQPKQD